MNVLYVDHTSLISGAQRALLDLLEVLPATVNPTVICPPGQLAEMVRRLGIDVVEFSGTSGSLRLHPVHTLRAGSEIVRCARVVKRTAKATGAEIIHSNSLRAGLIVGCIRGLSRTRTVLHVHDALPDTRSAAVIRYALGATADALITVSDYTTQNFAKARLHGQVHMLNNPLDTGRFDPRVMTQREARKAARFPSDQPLVGLVAQITPWKGQEVAIRALKLLQRRYPEARLLLVGEAKFVDRATRYDNVAYLQSLRQLVAQLGLEGHVEFGGEREDVPTVMRALDVLIAPSWEEPFGRSVIEAMALETAVVATNVGGPAEYIDDGVDGILLPPRDPERWAEALEKLFADAEVRAELGRRGSQKARTHFDRLDYAAKVLDVYETVVANAHRPNGSRQRPAPGGDGLRILLVEHQSVVGGAQRSLLELMRVLVGEHEVTLACPAGPLVQAAGRYGVSVVPIPDSQLTFRHDLRDTPREVMRTLRARGSVQGHVGRLRPDVVHANSLRAGLLAVTPSGGPVVVVHCRDLLPPNLTAALVKRVLLARSRAVVAVSRAAAARFAGPRWDERDVVVVDNPVDLDRFDPERLDRGEARRELGLTGSPVIGVLAQITPWKGQKRAVRILERLRRLHPHAQLILAGDTKFVTPATRFDNLGYERELHELIRELGLREAVHFLGEREDAERVIAALDVVLVPSTEEPFGRTVIEALAMQIPVVATNAGGPPEVIRAGLDGAIVPPDDIEAWAGAIRRLLDTTLPAGSRAYIAERFSPARHAAQIVAIYEQALATSIAGRA